MVILDTIGARWFALVFIALFLAAATWERGWKRAVRFWLVSAVVAFFAEYISTRHGFPYGRYAYIAEESELYLSNIPLFVPLSFGVVVWAGRSMAVTGLSARPLIETILGGAILTTMLDMAIDPMTLRGGQWFMGPLYVFDDPFGYFNVPWTNFLGWLIVSAVVIAIDELFEVGRPRVVNPLVAPALAYTIIGFFTAIALGTQNWRIAIACLGIGVAMTLMTKGGIGRLVRAASETEPAAAEAGG